MPRSSPHPAFTARDHASSGTGFSILRFSQLPLPGLAHIDGPAGGTWIDDPAAVTAYTTTFTHLQTSTLTRQKSAAKLSGLHGRARHER